MSTSALKKSGNSFRYVNIKNGKLVVKNTSNEDEFFDTIDGVITKIEFKEKEYQNRKYEVAEININNVGERFILSISVDSGYFRGFINSLRSSKPTELLTIKPFMKESDGKRQTTCFINQNDTAMKFFFTKDKMGDFPEAIPVVVGGKTIYDNTKQTQYWKNWLASVYTEAHQETNSISTYEMPNDADMIDDLPF
ncbi:MAG: hypothetical protein WCJ62_13770 [Flavobacterium sp.]